MKTFYIEGTEYDVPRDEYQEQLIMRFAADYGIPSERAKRIISDYDLADALSDRYDDEIGDFYEEECREQMRERL